MTAKEILKQIDELSLTLEMFASSARPDDDLDYIACKARIKRLREDQLIRIAQEHPAHV